MGSEAFAQRIRKIVSPQSHEPNVLRTRSRPDLTLDDVLNAVCGEYGIASGTLARKSSRHPARPIVALLASENSTATLQEIATVLGLADRRSVPQVIQRAQTITSDEVQHRLSIIQRRLEIVDESRSRNNPD
jgi:chromosomal replication initiation ATPase DnaA